jgi:hypothetical protein
MVQEEEEKEHKEEPSYYPPALEWYEQHPGDVQQEPPVDVMYCQYCLIIPCLYVKPQKEIERTDALLYPEHNNRAKRLMFYHRMTRELYGHIGKGV